MIKINFELSLKICVQCTYFIFQDFGILQYFGIQDLLTEPCSLIYRTCRIKNAFFQTNERSLLLLIQDPIVQKAYAAITHVEFSPVHPHNYAVTCSAKVGR